MVTKNKRFTIGKKTVKNMYSLIQFETELYKIILMHEIIKMN